MDTYFFDSTPKALVKSMFLLITYFSSLLFKTFDIAVILPVVLIYFLSNIGDYAELAFFRTDKTKRIRLISFLILLYFALSSVITFCLFTTTKDEIILFVNHYYAWFYPLCAVVWSVPLIDSIRSTVDAINKSANVVELQMKSSRSLNVMYQSVNPNYRPNP